MSQKQSSMASMLEEENLESSVSANLQIKKMQRLTWRNLKKNDRMTTQMATTDCLQRLMTCLELSMSSSSQQDKFQNDLPEILLVLETSLKEIQEEEATAENSSKLAERTQRSLCLDL